MINANQLREYIIKPALTDLVMLSDDAVELMMFTCAVESNGGTYIKQVNGPALGIYQMEPNTYNDIWQNYLKSRSSLLMMLLSNFECVSMPSEDRLIYDLRFATAMTRIHYYRVAEKIPPHQDIDTLWEYYKTHYNTSQGAAEKHAAIKQYYNFTSG